MSFYPIIYLLVHVATTVILPEDQILRLKDLMRMSVLDILRNATNKKKIICTIFGWTRSKVEQVKKQTNDIVQVGNIAVNQSKLVRG